MASTLPPIDEIRADLLDADPDWTGNDALALATWCDLFEVDGPSYPDSTPGMPGNDDPDERHGYDA
jgi:hypothetical protein